ncbi:MAG: N-acetyltransferase [Pseudomonadota bacterium]
MRVDWTRPDEAASWAAARIKGCERGWAGFQAAFVVNAAGKDVAAVVFHDWNPEAGVIEVSAAAQTPRWAARSVLTELFGYAFNGCGCQAVAARTTSERVAKLWQGFGATKHEIPRLAGRDRALTLLVLTDDAWRASRLNGGLNGETKISYAA